VLPKVLVVTTDTECIGGSKNDIVLYEAIEVVTAIGLRLRKLVHFCGAASFSPGPESILSNAHTTSCSLLRCRFSVYERFE
jgi:hypothetical protein